MEREVPLSRFGAFMDYHITIMGITVGKEVYKKVKFWAWPGIEPGTSSNHG